MLKKRNYLRKIFKNFLIAWFFWKEWTQCDIYENVLGRQADATLWFYTWLVFLSWFSCVTTKPPLAGKSDIFSIYILSLLCIVVLVLSHQWQRQTAAISIWRHTWNNERKEIIHCLCCLFWFSYTFIVFRKKAFSYSTRRHHSILPWNYGKGWECVPTFSKTQLSSPVHILRIWRYYDCMHCFRQVSQFQDQAFFTEIN